MFIYTPDLFISLDTGSQMAKKLLFMNSNLLKFVSKKLPMDDNINGNVDKC